MVSYIIYIQSHLNIFALRGSPGPPLSPCAARDGGAAASVPCTATATAICSTRRALRMGLSCPFQTQTKRKGAEGIAAQFMERHLLCTKPGAQETAGAPSSLQQPQRLLPIRTSSAVVENRSAHTQALLAITCSLLKRPRSSASNTSSRGARERRPNEADMAGVEGTMNGTHLQLRLQCAFC